MDRAGRGETMRSMIVFPAAGILRQLPVQPQRGAKPAPERRRGHEMGASRVRDKSRTMLLVLVYSVLLIDDCQCAPRYRTIDEDVLMQTAAMETHHPTWAMSAAAGDGSQRQRRGP